MRFKRICVPVSDSDSDDEHGSTFLSTIFITDGEYADHLSDTEMLWCGQLSGRNDHKCVIGTRIFYRKKGNTPYTYLGVVKSKELKTPGQVVHLKDAKGRVTKKIDKVLSTPSQYFIKFLASAATIKCDNATTTGSGMWQRAAWDFLGYPYPNEPHCSGIYMVNQ